MRCKVEEIEGAALDAAVALADGWTFYRNKRNGITINRPDGSRDEVGNNPPKFDSDTGLPVKPISIQAAMMAGNFFPSSEWGDGGPIIERERISTYFEETPKAAWHAEFEHAARADGVQLTFAKGDTLLIAAMRAYVASKFGDEVDLPT